MSRRSRVRTLHFTSSEVQKWNISFKCVRVVSFNYSRHSSYVECNDISIRSFRSFDNFLFKFNVSLPLVTGELLQNTVDVNNVTYKLYNIKIQRLPVLLNTKNYLSTGQAIT